MSWSISVWPPSVTTTCFLPSTVARAALTSSVQAPASRLLSSVQRILAATARGLKPPSRSRRASEASSEQGIERPAASASEIGSRQDPQQTEGAGAKALWAQSTKLRSGQASDLGRTGQTVDLSPHRCAPRVELLHLANPVCFCALRYYLAICRTDIIVSSGPCPRGAAGWRVGGRKTAAKEKHKEWPCPHRPASVHSARSSTGAWAAASVGRPMA